jgi:hypothetical protein
MFVEQADPPRIENLLSPGEYANPKRGLKLFFVAFEKNWSTVPRLGKVG